MSPELKEVLFQALGEASMCWSENPNGIFKSDRCKEIGEEVICVFDLAAEESGMCAKSDAQQLKAEIATMLSKWKHCCELGVDWYEVEIADYERLREITETISRLADVSCNCPALYKL